MSRDTARQPVAFAVVIVATLALALLPFDLRFDRSVDLARLARIPLRPFTHPLNLLRGWLSSPPALPVDGEPALGPEERIRRLSEERDIALRSELAARQRVRELEEEVAQLQRLPAEVFRAARAVLVADIVRRAVSGAPDGVVEVRLRRGSRGIIEPGAIAVTGGVHLLGRVWGEPTDLSCLVLPVVHPSTGLIRARVGPPDRPADSLVVQLEPTGIGGFVGDAETGGFVADVDRLSVVAIGDLVRLDDRAWPLGAQQMILGRVVSIETRRDQPLRRTLVVRPEFRLTDVAGVTLVAETIGETAP